jgi:hypothetical protein
MADSERRRWRQHQVPHGGDFVYLVPMREDHRRYEDQYLRHQLNKPMWSAKYGIAKSNEKTEKTVSFHSNSRRRSRGPERSWRRRLRRGAAELTSGAMAHGAGGFAAAALGHHHRRPQPGRRCRQRGARCWQDGNENAARTACQPRPAPWCRGCGGGGGLSVTAAAAAASNDEDSAPATCALLPLPLFRSMRIPHRQ